MNTEQLHELVWTRFIRMPYGHLLDYADENGSTPIPTAEECQNSIPNVMGWATSTENGAMFSGLYLYGLLEKYDFAPTEKLKQEIRILADGLLLLCDVGKTNGFIARGVGDDGISHYPYSSEDQLGPWVLGLWRLLKSPAADESYRAEILPRMIRTLKGIHAADWAIPTEIAGITNGDLSRADWRGVSKLLFCAAVSREIGIINQTEFQKLIHEKPTGSIYSRRELISHGFGPSMIRNTGLIQFWICMCAHLCAKELIMLDPENAEYYRHGITANGFIALGFAADYKKYIIDSGKVFNYNWRQLIPGIIPWNTPTNAVKEAKRQLVEFNHKLCPAIPAERYLLMQALFAAWISVLCGDPDTETHAAFLLFDAIETVNWNEVGMCYAFIAEAALYCYQNAHKHNTRHGE